MPLVNATETRCETRVSRFHDVEPLVGLEMMQQSELSVAVVSKSLRTVPYPLLGENTLVLSDNMIVAPDEKGRLALMFRCVFRMAAQPRQWCGANCLGHAEA